MFSCDLEEHLKRLEMLFQRFAAAGLKLKPSKCHLLQKEVLFLGHRVNKVGISTDGDKISQVWPVPRNLKEVSSFLGLCSHNRKYVKNIARVAEPLHALTHKGRKFEWTEECNKPSNN